MMNVAHHYAKCYWNASGEFDCGQGRSDSPVPNDVNQSCQRQCRKFPLNNSQSDSDVPRPLSPEYAQFTRPKVTESYRNPPQTAPSQKYTELKPRLTGKADDFDPLNREMEISIYMPDRDTQYPWQNDHDEGNHESYQPNYGHEEETRPNHNREQPAVRKMRIAPEIQTPNPQLQQREMTEHVVRAPPNDVHIPTFSNQLQLPTPQLIQVMQQPIQIPRNLQWSQKSKYLSHFQGKVNKYYFQLPSQKYYELIDEFGPPKLVNMNRGGIAIWQKSAFKNTSYHFIRRIDLIDEQCFNSFPIPHVGFLYTHVKMDIPMTKISSVISMCGDVMYDPIKKIFIVRGMSLYYNLAIIALTCLYIFGQLTWYQITEGDLIRKSLSYKQLTNRKSQERNLRTISKYLTPGKLNELKI